jgi:hypothetical protein
MTSTKKIMNHWKGRIGSLLFVVAVLGLLGPLFLARVDPESMFKTSQKRKLSSKYPSVVIAEKDLSNHPSQTTLRTEIRNKSIYTRPSLRTLPSSGKPANASLPSERAPRRKLPGGYADFYGDPAMAGGAVLFVILLLFLLCCCRGMICDILACVCLYEMCCDDGAVGGFDLMPF